MPHTLKDLQSEHKRLVYQKSLPSPQQYLIQNIHQSIISGNDLNPILVDFWFKNFSFTPICVSGLTIPIRGESVNLLRKKFNIPENREITEIKPDYYCGHTTDYYYFIKSQKVLIKNGNGLQEQVNSVPYWIYKKDLDLHPLHQLWNSMPINFDSLNQLLTKNNRSLKEHQFLAIKFLLHVKRGFLEDEQGLMKTSTSISAAILSKSKKILIITLASTKINWSRELKYYDIQEFDLVMGTGHTFKNCKYTIINYDVLANYQSVSKKEKPFINVLAEQGFDCIIVDECHKVKDLKSNRSQVLKHISTLPHVNYVWGLSGTLIEKNEEFFEICCALGVNVQNEVLTSNGYTFPVQKNSFDNYKIRYCNGFAANFGKKNAITGVPQTPKMTIVPNKKNPNSNTEALSTVSSPYRLRRTFLQVFPHFVNLNEDILYFKLTPLQLREYSDLYEKFYQNKEIVNDTASVATELLLMRQYLAIQQVKHTTQFVERLLDDGYKVIIFTHFKEELERLYANFNSIAVHLQAAKNEYNQAQIDKFQNDDDVRVIIGNIQTMGTGHNITKGDYIIHNSPDWGSGEMAQANSRSWRFGREGDVNVVYMLFEGLVSEYVYGKAMVKKENKQKFDNI